ncbi:MAG: hypothetical protein M1608_09855, partial [Candidatus Omnitrophica bacterium]|nr:hypothetical protein [Candidatus Omnitrophota bacterium]
MQPLLAARFRGIRSPLCGVVDGIVPQACPAEVSYFARRKPSAAFKRLDESGKTGRGADSAQSVS